MVRQDRRSVSAVTLELGQQLATCLEVTERTDDVIDHQWADQPQAESSVRDRTLATFSCSKKN